MGDIQYSILAVDQFSLPLFISKYLTFISGVLRGLQLRRLLLVYVCLRFIIYFGILFLDYFATVSTSTTTTAIQRMELQRFGPVH